MTEGLSRAQHVDEAVIQTCDHPCCKRFNERKAIIAQGRERARFARESGRPDQALAEAANRLDRYNTGIIRARAAEDVYGRDDPPHCLEELGPDAAAINAALGMPPGTVRQSDLVDDETGYRAGIYRSQSDGSVIVAYRGTLPEMLVDWETNIQNGLGRDTAQYRQARDLAEQLAVEGVEFDITGHSKGGGMASMAATVVPGVETYTFNAAGVSPRLVEAVGGSLRDLNQRLDAYRFDEEFLTSMQSVVDPAEKIRRAERLRDEMAGEAGLINPMTIEQISPAQVAERRALEEAPLPRGRAERRTGRRVRQEALSREAEATRTAIGNFLQSFDDEIEAARASMEKGGDLSEYFPPALGEPVDLGPAPNPVYLNARLNTLMNHKIEVVIDRMEETKRSDQADIQAALSRPLPAPRRLPALAPDPVGPQ